MTETPQGRRRRPPDQPRRPVPVVALHKGDSFRWQGRTLTIAKVSNADPVPGRLVIEDSDGNRWPFGGADIVDLVT